MRQFNPDTAERNWLVLVLISLAFWLCWIGLADAQTKKTIVDTDSTQTISNKTINLPTISDFTNAQHDHSTAAKGGALSDAPHTSLKVGDGSESAPSYSFSLDTDNGLYRIGADNLGISIGGTLRFDLNTTRLLTTLPIYAPNGSASAPSYAFSGATGLGFYRFQAGDEVGFRQNSSANIKIVMGAGYKLASDAAIYWGDNVNLDVATMDMSLIREAARVLALRYDTNGQTFRVYGTFTDSSNYERLSLSDDGANSIIASEAAGTGVAHPLVFRVAGANRWNINTSGDFIQTGSAPTVGGSCGTGPAIAGQDSAGKVTTGTGSPTSCTVTFASAWVTAPACVVSNETTANLARATSTTTTVVLAGTMVAGDVLAYICMGY